MDYLGFTELDLKIIKEHERLLKKRVLKNPDGARLQALLDQIIHSGSLQQLREILAAGADPNFMYNSGETPLELVLRWRSEGCGAVDFFRELVRHGADPMRPGRTKSIMSAACEHANTDWAIGAMLDAAPGRIAQADLNKALLAAANDDALTGRLLSSGASVNSLQASTVLDTPVSPLMLASLYGNPEVAKALLAAGADVNLTDGEGHTALDYALFNPAARRRVAPVLKRAGGVSKKPFLPPGHRTKDLAAAAKRPAYREAVASIARLTGIKPSPLVSDASKIPGGQGFLFAQALGQTLVEGGFAEFKAHADTVREFVERHQAEMLSRGGYLFYSRDIVSKNGDVVALLPTTDVYRVIAALETNGQDSTDDLIAWLRELEKDQPFVITGIGRDFIDGRFTTPVKDAAALVRRINQICPEGGDTPSEIATQAAHLRRAGRLFLWWD